MMTKAELRTELLRRRASLSQQQLDAAGSAIADRIERIDAVRTARSIALYLSMTPEPPTWALADRLRERGVGVLTPLVRSGRRLEWAEYAGRERLRAAAYGISEPATPPRGVQAIGDVDAVVLPALAVDRLGHRLGRGAGYYDRALAYASPVAARIAVVYDDELVARLPTEDHDEPVHLVVTPERTWCCTGPE